MTAPASHRFPTRWFMAAIAVVCVLTVQGCAFGPPPPDETGQPPNLPVSSSSAMMGDSADSIVTSELATGLTTPWDIAFLPDGSALVTERNTRRILTTATGQESSPTPRPSPSSNPKGLLNLVPIQTIEEAVSSDDGGLFGIAVSPSYSTDNTVFIYYSTDTDNRIAKLILGGHPQPIVTGLPRTITYNGGALRFGPDGMLYASTGVGSNRQSAQDTASLGGKILRMTSEGKPAQGNPFGNLVYSYGHRGIQGFTWNADGKLYAVEHGQDKTNEVNIINPGKNYGWPIVEGNGTDSRYTNPAVTWSAAETSCSGVEILANVLITACLRGERLMVVRFATTGTALGAPQSLLVGAFGRLRAIVAAPDGSLWVTTSNKDGQGKPKQEDDRIIRIIFGNLSDAGKT